MVAKLLGQIINRNHESPIPVPFIEIIVILLVVLLALLLAKIYRKIGYRAENTVSPAKNLGDIKACY